MNLFYFLIWIMIFFIKCSSKSDDTDDIPSNLMFSAVLQGADVTQPTGDGSGVVTFKVSATNATSYKILLGDGSVPQTISDGNFVYTYLLSGTNTYSVSVSAYKGSASISKTISITIAKKASTTPTWSDEFDVDGVPNTKNWKYDIGTGSNGWGNNEIQYYTNRSENVYVSNGTLKIVAKKESYQGSAYTSARLLSQDKYSFKYGRVEVRAKLPATLGTWPAIWMLGSNISSGVVWPNCGEIDIMEYSPRIKGVGKILGTLHYPQRFGGNAYGAETIIQNPSTEFHVYKLEWSSTLITISVDGVAYFSFANSLSFPFNQNFFFILNVAMGGSLGGDVDANFSSDIMEIDYIRVYQ